jgi:hypothetical protein
MRDGHDITDAPIELKSASADRYPDRAHRSRQKRQRTAHRRQRRTGADGTIAFPRR